MLWVVEEEVNAKRTHFTGHALAGRAVEVVEAASMGMWSMPMTMDWRRGRQTGGVWAVGGTNDIHMREEFLVGKQANWLEDAREDRVRGRDRRWWPCITLSNHSCWICVQHSLFLIGSCFILFKVHFIYLTIEWFCYLIV